MLSSVCRRLLSTWLVSTAGRQMLIVRRRATMPSVMSIATEMAVTCAPPTTVKSRMPGAM